MSLKKWTLKIFGKKDCPACKGARQKFEVFLNRWNLSDSVEMSFYDMDTVDGLTEGTFYGVSKVPTTILEDDSRELARWEGEVPLSQDFKKYFTVF